MHKLKSIGIYGSSSGRNAGDAALISGIMDGIDDALGRRLVYEIPSYRPDYIWYQYENKTRPASMLPWHGSVGMFGVPTALSFRRCDLNVVYDNMLFDKKLWNQLFNYMPAVWWYFTKQRRPGQLLGMYNVGCGPVTTSTGRKMLKEVADVCDFITVRDQDSLDLLRDVGVTHDRILRTADAALTVNPAPKSRVAEILHKAGLEVGQDVLAVNVNSYLGSWSGSKGSNLTAEEFVKIYGAALTQIAGDLKLPLAFITTQHSDLDITDRVRNAVSRDIKSYLVSNIEYNHAEMKGLLGEMSFLFAMRLHANILATSETTPSVALSFQKKVTSYYQELGLPENVLTFDDLSANKIADHVANGWARRREIKAHLTSRIPYLQKKSLVTSGIVAALDSGKTGAEAIEIGRQMMQRVESEFSRPSLSDPVIN